MKKYLQSSSFDKVSTLRKWFCFDARSYCFSKKVVLKKCLFWRSNIVEKVVVLKSLIMRRSICFEKVAPLSVSLFQIKFVFRESSCSENLAALKGRGSPSKCEVMWKWGRGTRVNGNVCSKFFNWTPSPSTTYNSYRISHSEIPVLLKISIQKKNCLCLKLWIN